MRWKKKKQATADRQAHRPRRPGAGRRLNRRRGFHPDLLADVGKTITAAAEKLDRQLIKLATDWGLRRPTAPTSFATALRDVLTRGIGRLTRHAISIEEQATDVGQATAADVLTAIDPAALAQAVATTPKPPRNPGTGVTVRAPKRLRDAIRDMAPTINGSTTALYRDIARRVQAAPPESEAARRRLAQQALDGLKGRGITGFIDKAGKRWNLVSYVEMATRTAATALAREAHAQAVQAAGLDVVRVTVMPNCHPFCQPYQGRLLSLTGATTKWEGEKVAATLAEAVANGYNHPNCRHTIQVAIPGVNVPDPDAIDPGDYAATQKLRRLERQLRAAKRAESTATTDQAAKTSGQKVRHYQGRIRAHIDATGIPRNRWREQIENAL